MKDLTVPYTYQTVACPVEQPVGSIESNGLEVPFGVEANVELANRWKKDFRQFLASTKEIEASGILVKHEGKAARHFLTATLPQPILQREIG